MTTVENVRVSLDVLGNNIQTRIAKESEYMEIVRRRLINIINSLGDCAANAAAVGAVNPNEYNRLKNDIDELTRMLRDEGPLKTSEGNVQGAVNTTFANIQNNILKLKKNPGTPFEGLPNIGSEDVVPHTPAGLDVPVRGGKKIMKTKLVKKSHLRKKRYTRRK